MTNSSCGKGTTMSLGAALVLVMAPVLLAQDRMPPIAEDQMTQAQREAVEEFLRAGDATRLGGPFVPLLRSPEMLSRARNVGAYVRFNSALPPRLRELVIVIIARHWTQQIMWAGHASLAERAELRPEILGAIADGRRPDLMAEDEAAVYDFCTELLRTHRVSDPTYARVVSLFEENGVIDTIGIMGYYSMLAMVMNTARTPLREGALPLLEAFPR